MNHLTYDETSPSGLRWGPGSVQGKRDISGEVAGSKDSNGYWRVRCDGLRFLAHHLVWELHHGVKPKQLDHIDGDQGNNKIGNLRECTQSENCFNRKIGSNNTSGTRGVTWDKSREKWIVTAMVRGKRKTLGRFSDKDSAVKCAVDFHKAQHGEFYRNTGGSYEQ